MTIPNFTDDIDIIRKANEVNFVSKGCPDDLIELIFGPIEPSDVFAWFSNEENLEHLIVKCGKMSSLSQARKNNWAGKIEPGFQERIIGKNKTKIFIFKHIDEM